MTYYLQLNRVRMCWAVWTQNSWSLPSGDVHNVIYCLLNGGTVLASLTHSKPEEDYCYQQSQKCTLSWYVQNVLTKEECSPESQGIAGSGLCNFSVAGLKMAHSLAHNPQVHLVHWECGRHVVLLMVLAYLLCIVVKIKGVWGSWSA